MDGFLMGSDCELSVEAANTKGGKAE
jgi:hypothetical protein